MASQKESFATFIKSKTAKKGCDHTHTRIPDKKLNIYPGSYTLNDSDLKNFYKKYYKHVFVDKNQEYLTEKQLFSSLEFNTSSGPSIITAAFLLFIISLFKIKQTIKLKN